ncbi:hypothetical protein, partial [Cobetia crustatorum]|uniref:hypothetical protein n=1 Tax=Cobetia crustatorum TaxID=553385 RepID=UPI000557968D
MFTIKLKHLFVVLLFLSNSAHSEDTLGKTKDEFMNDSRQICDSQWRKRGILNESMYAYCMNKKIENYKEISYLKPIADKDFSETAYPYCYDEWTKRGLSDTRMISYCLKNEIEGIKDVRYYYEKYDNSEVQRIVNTYMTRSGSWHFTAYMPALFTSA